MNKWFVPLIAMMVLSSVVGAEGGCPLGQHPYDTPAARQCVPIPGADSSSSSAPTTRYETRWGAIAADGPKGILGSANGQRTKRGATKLAVEDCQRKGGNCKVELAYHDQCAVLVSGDRLYFAQGPENADVATKVALEKCGKVDVGCRIHYSGCSYPEQVE